MSNEWKFNEEDGCLYSDNFTHDATLWLDGDFEDEEQKKRYAEMLCAKLNAVNNS